MGVNEDFMKDDEYVDDEVPLPGFRFHPTDEELVSFYLRRKLEEKPISIELIKQIDIYKFDPWDLPSSGSGGEKEGYFYCQRGRKYRNSIRPNRVTGSGFWKATGIDKPVYSHGGEGNDCIGLKKTLVYYRGSAGKGTKTDWMMHEFRLPSNTIHTNTKLANAKNNDTDIALEAEIWTLCRIFKRNVTQRKHMPGMRHSSSASNKRHCNNNIDMMNTRNRKNSSVELSNDTNQEPYINFGASLGYYHQNNNEQKHNNNVINYTCSSGPRNQFHANQFNSPTAQQPQITTTTAPYASSNFWFNQTLSNDFFTFENWDELGSVVKYAGDDSPSL